jgi:hypothetical protein
MMKMKEFGALVLLSAAILAGPAHAQGFHPFLAAKAAMEASREAKLRQPGVHVVKGSEQGTHRVVEVGQDGRVVSQRDVSEQEALDIQTEQRREKLGKVFHSTPKDAARAISDKALSAGSTVAEGAHLMLEKIKARKAEKQARESQAPEVNPPRP